MSAWPASLELPALGTLDESLLYIFVVGPGEGEAVAVALPQRSGWLLVDGCKTGASESGLVEVLRLYRRSDEPILVYALTHPHLDHARGVVELCEAYGSAIRAVAVTPPWTNDDRGTTITSQRIVGSQVAKGLAALRKLTARRVDLEAGATLATSKVVAVNVLSPPAGHSMSDANDASAAIVVQYGKARILLGSDLPSNTPGNSGWHDILARAPTHGDAIVLKIPHHCSKTSHHEEVFPAHSQERAWVATPFNGHHLPELVDMDGLPWILKRGCPVHLTAPPVSKHAQVPVAHPARTSVGALSSRVSTKPTGIPLLDRGAVETTPRAIRARDSLWCFAVDAGGALVGRWRGSAAIEVTG